MAKNNNVIVEIQELIQQIKNEYQEGVDFEFVAPNIVKQGGGGARIKIISPKLKRFCRERFSLPHYDTNFLLDWERGDQAENDVYYRIGDNSVECDHLDYVTKGIYRHNNNSLGPNKCKVCGKLTSYEKGQIVEWSRGNIPGTEIIGRFHPDCAKKHFTSKEQPNENNTRIKEKLLRNLDKICLDPRCDLANAEVLKQAGAEKKYNLRDNWDEWTKKAYKVEIEGEEIELNSDKETAIIIGSYEQREIKRALMQEIKQNSSEWEIAEREEDLKECEGENYIIKHKSGRRHWDDGFYRFWGSTSENEKMGKEWDKIKSALKGYKIPDKNNKLNNFELENLKKIFKECNIRKITFENNKQAIEYDNKFNSLKKVDNGQFKELEKYCQEHNEHEIDWQRLGINSNNTIVNPKQDNNNHQLVIGLVLGGAGVVLVAGLLFYFIRQKSKNR